MVLTATSKIAAMVNCNATPVKKNGNRCKRCYDVNKEKKFVFSNFVNDDDNDDDDDVMKNDDDYGL